MAVQGEFEWGEKVLHQKQQQIALQKIQQAIDLGASGGFNYKEEGWAKEMSKQADAPNLIIDSAGGAGYKSLLTLAAEGGRIVNYGATTGPAEKVDLFKVFWKQLRLIGSTMGSRQDFNEMLQFVTEKELAPAVDSVRPLEEGNSAVESMRTSEQFGKFVLEIQ